MRHKGIVLATGLLLVLAVGGWLVKNGLGPSRPAGLVGKSLLAGVEVGKAAALKITKGAEQVTLRAGPDGWLVAEQGNFPAQADKILKFLLKLEQQVIAHKVTDNPERLGALGLLRVSENGGKFENQKTAAAITLSDEGGKVLFELLLGNDRRADSTQNGAYGGQYVRFPAKKAAYLVPETFYLDFEPQQWLDSKIFPFDKPNTLKSFSLSHAGQKKLLFSRPDEKGAWSLAGTPQLEQEQVNTFAEKLVSITINRLSQPGQDAKALGREKLATFEMELFDGRRYRFTMGEKKATKDDLRFLAFSAGLSPTVENKELQKEVAAFDARFAGRFPAFYDWEAKNLLKTRKDFLPAKKK